MWLVTGLRNLILEVMAVLSKPSKSLFLQQGNMLSIKNSQSSKRGLNEILQPGVIGDFVRCAFYDYHGIVIELQQYLGDENR